MHEQTKKMLLQHAAKLPAGPDRAVCFRIAHEPTNGRTVAQILLDMSPVSAPRWARDVVVPAGAGLLIDEFGNRSDIDFLDGSNLLDEGISRATGLDINPIRLEAN